MIVWDWTNPAEQLDKELKYRYKRYNDKYIFIDKEDYTTNLELFDKIKFCILNKNTNTYNGKTKIYNKNHHNKREYKSNLDVTFEEIVNPRKDNISKKIGKIPHKDLDNNYIINSFNKKKTCTLINFDDKQNIKTILTFFFNEEYSCIEIDSFRSLKDGGIIFNYLINSIKCAIDICNERPNCKGEKYENKIILNAFNIEGLLNYYNNFGLKTDSLRVENVEKDLVPLYRELSVDSKQDASENLSVDSKQDASENLSVNSKQDDSENLSVDSKQDASENLSVNLKQDANLKIIFDLNSLRSINNNNNNNDIINSIIDQNESIKTNNNLTHSVSQTSSLPSSLPSSSKRSKTKRKRKPKPNSKTQNKKPKIK